MKITAIQMEEFVNTKIRNEWNVLFLAFSEFHLLV